VATSRAAQGLRTKFAQPFGFLEISAYLGKLETHARMARQRSKPPTVDAQIRLELGSEQPAGKAPGRRLSETHNWEA